MLLDLAPLMMNDLLTDEVISVQSKTLIINEIMNFGTNEKHVFVVEEGVVGDLGNLGNIVSIPFYMVLVLNISLGGGFVPYTA